jgi:hypothetical protein
MFSCAARVACRAVNTGAAAAAVIAPPAGVNAIVAANIVGQTERGRSSPSVAPAVRGRSRPIVKIYERLLPYATPFGLEKEWAGELGKYYDQHPPDWYDGGSVGAFSAGYFAGSIASFGSSVSSSYSASASASSSGGSGGGGGFGACRF